MSIDFSKLAIIIAILSLTVSVGSCWIAFKAYKSNTAFQAYEYAPRFQIEDENMSYACPKPRCFSYDAVLHNLGTRALDISAVYLCAVQSNEKGCPRHYQIALNFLIKPGGKWHFAFDSSQEAVSSLMTELTDVELLLQIEYSTADHSVSVHRKKIGGFKGNDPIMFAKFKAATQ